MIKTALPRTVASCLCKTHKWLLVELGGADIFWYGSPGVTFSIGTQRDSLEQMLDIIQTEGHYWTLYAVTEPTLSEQDAPRAIDLMFPFQGTAAICGKLTPGEQLAELNRYLKKNLDCMGLQGHLRGLDTLPEPETAQYTMEPVLVNKHSLFLCTAKVRPSTLMEETGLFGVNSAPADYIWFNQAVLNLFPARGYFQKLFGHRDVYGSYCIAAMEDISDAASVFDMEANALSTFLSDNTAAGDNKLYRIISADSDEYIDSMLCDPAYTSTSIRALTTLGKKFIMMNNRAETMTLPDVDITKNATHTKIYLLQHHQEDALAPIVNLGWENL